MAVGARDAHANNVRELQNCFYYVAYSYSACVSIILN